MGSTSHSDIAASIEENSIQLYLLAAEVGGKTVKRDADLTYVCSKPYWPSFLLQPNFARESIGERLAELAKQIRSYEIPPYLRFGPLAQPPDLADLLEAHGFENVGFAPPGMAADLDTMTLPDPGDIPLVRVVRDTTDVEVWMGESSSFDLRMLDSLCEDDRFFLFIGLREGRAVARAMMFAADGVAGLYHVAVDEGYRRQGHGTSVTVAAMRKARELGNHLCVLHASPMGERLYAHLGFREYFRFNYYGWTSVNYSDYIRS